MNCLDCNTEVDNCDFCNNQLDEIVCLENKHACSMRCTLDYETFNKGPIRENIRW